MCKKPVHVVKVKESEHSGMPSCRFCCRIYPDMVEAADRVVKIERIYEPRREPHERYQKLFELYKKLYLHLKEDFYSLSEIRDGDEPFQPLKRSQKKEDEDGRVSEEQNMFFLLTLPMVLLGFNAVERIGAEARNWVVQRPVLSR